jgi:dienelactone hydrolase
MKMRKSHHQGNTEAVIRASPVAGRKLRRTALCVAAVVAGSLLGCSAPRHGGVSVTPESSLFDQPVHIVVSGLDPGRAVTVGLRSTDALGHVWASQAVLRSNGSGTIDLASAKAVSGSYQGVNPMGLIDALQPASSQATAYYWNVRTPQRFQVTVTEDGSKVAAGAFSRGGGAPGVTVTNESIAATGFFGQFWKPPAGSPPRPAVLVFGGSEGGLDGQLLGGALASAGYPTLNIAYFGESGLPSQLKDIPLEYFAGALQWLARQPGVLPGQVDVSGVSRGSEAALLLGAYYPGLVHGVIASSPGNVSLCSYPGCAGPAWTLHGQPLPYTTQFDNPDPTDNPAAVIPVQNIKGPVFLDCGTDDQTWTSCAFARAIQSRLTAVGDRYAHVLYRYLGAGHLVGSLIPYEPTSYATANLGPGDTPLANTDADARLWPDVLSFLADPARHSGTFTAPATPPPLKAH